MLNECAMKMVEVYVETSVINGCFSRDPYIERTSKLFFEKVRRGNVVAHTSVYAVAEIIKAPDGAKRDKLFSILVLCKTDAPSGKAVEDLGKEYIGCGAIPAEYEMDAFHVASATLGGYEALVTWNREHIKKLKTIRIVGEVNQKKGLKTPIITDPEALV